MTQKKGAVLVGIVFLFILAFLFTEGGYVLAENSNCTPVASGWNITTYVACENTTISMTGNITIGSGGTLNLTNVSILFNTSKGSAATEEWNEELYLIVNSGGVLWANRSTINN
ncbi:hypothetical protein HY643_01720, partial [Candidatus Woesearchaeota archaeon]|nr:hypothetical protein [Candidatus Woesearchaeota archaeon]